MVTSTTDPAIRGILSGGRRPRLRRVLATVGVVLAIWLLSGVVRADLVARDYFTRIHDGQLITNIETQLGPAIPPLWSVTIDGDVTQSGQTSPAYRSHMVFWVEPITGWAIVMNAG